MIELFDNIVNLLTDTLDTIINTANRLDTITFETTLFADYLGYARYTMGDPLYMLFTTVILISIGVTLWTYLLKGIGYIINLKPW